MRRRGVQSTARAAWTGWLDHAVAALLLGLTAAGPAWAHEEMVLEVFARAGCPLLSGLVMLALGGALVLAPGLLVL